MDTDLDKCSISQTQKLINDLKDDNLNVWRYFFNKIMPHSDIFFDQLQSRQIDTLKLQEK